MLTLISSNPFKLDVFTQKKHFLQGSKKPTIHLHEHINIIKCLSKNFTTIFTVKYHFFCFKFMLTKRVTTFSKLEVQTEVTVKSGWS